MILGIRDNEDTIIAASFNHYDYVGLTDIDLLAPENSPFLWHPSFANGVMAIADSSRFKGIIQSLDFPAIEMTYASLYQNLLVPLKKELVRLGLEEEHKYLQDDIFLMSDGLLAQIDSFGVIEINQDVVMTDGQRGITLDSLEIHQQASPLSKIDAVMQAQNRYIHRQTCPFTYVSSKKIDIFNIYKI